jgi:hypothetical protein
MPHTKRPVDKGTLYSTPEKLADGLEKIRDEDAPTPSKTSHYKESKKRFKIYIGKRGGTYVLRNNHKIYLPMK